jgi:riboflavin kinase/FMN adenylyltransferase
MLKFHSQRHIFRGLPTQAERLDCALAIGNFDGVHLGHQALLKGVVQAAGRRGLVPAVLTFEPHPREVFGQEPLKRIGTLRDKLERIRACGIERIFVLPFLPEFAALTPAEFARTILSEGLACRWVTVGENFRFGARRAGTIGTLEELGRHYGFEVYPSPLLFSGDTRISSSRIRAALELGDLMDAARMLGGRYYVTGRVTHGQALGRTIGFPTLNQRLLPPGSRAQFALHGVYAVRVTGVAPMQVAFAGMASLGTKPTVGGKAWCLETSVFDWKGDAYGKIVRIEFVAKIRDEKRFSGIEELKAAIAHDEIEARRILGIML